MWCHNNEVSNLEIICSRYHLPLQSLKFDHLAPNMHLWSLLPIFLCQNQKPSTHCEGILPKGPYLPCVSMAGRALLAGYHRLRLRQNGCHFTSGIFKRILLNENVRIFINISLKFTPNGPVDNVSALVQIMTWRRTSNKPLSEPMMAFFTDEYKHLSASMS